MLDNLKAQFERLEPPARYAAIAGVAVAGILLAVLLIRAIPTLLDALGPFIVIAVIFLLYWLPTVIAFRRGHVSRGGILILNLVAGWTVIGWIVCLIWAAGNAAGAAPVQNTLVVTNVVAPPQTPYGASAPAAPAMPVPQIGDVVNGHQFDGDTWVPIALPPMAPPPVLPPPGLPPNQFVTDDEQPR